MPLILAWFIAIYVYLTVPARVSRCWSARSRDYEYETIDRTFKNIKLCNLPLLGYVCSSYIPAYRVWGKHQQKNQIFVCLSFSFSRVISMLSFLSLCNFRSPTLWAVYSALCRYASIWHMRSGRPQRRMPLQKMIRSTRTRPGNMPSICIRNYPGEWCVVSL